MEAAVSPSLLRAVTAALFLFLALPGLGRPGLSPEEARFGLAAQEIFARADRGPAAGHHLVLAGRRFPLMVRHNRGAAGAYLIAAAVAVLGPGPLAVRLVSVLWMLAALLLFFELCLRWFGARTALFAGVLAASNPLFVQLSRTGFAWGTLLLIPMALWVLFALKRWLEGGTRLWLFSCAFAAGAGLWVDRSFLLCAAAAGSLALGWSRRRTGKPFPWRGAVLFFAAGAAPWLLFCLLEPSWALRLPEGAAGVLTGYPAALRERAGELFSLLSAQAFPRRGWGMAPASVFELRACAALAAAAAGAAAFSAWTAFRDGWADKTARDRMLFAGSFCVLLAALSPLTVPARDFGAHLLPLLPFAVLFLAWTADRLASRWTHVRAGRVLLGAGLLLPVLVLQLGLNAEISSAFVYARPSALWTPAAGAAETLLAQGARLPVVSRGGLGDKLRFLSGRRLEPLLCRKRSDILEFRRRAALTGDAAFWVGVRETSLCAKSLAAQGLLRDSRPLGRGLRMARLPAVEPEAGWMAGFLARPRTRRDAAAALGKLAVRDPAAAGLLVGLLSSGDPVVRFRARSGLLAAGPAAAGPLREAMRSGGPAGLRAAGALLRAGDLSPEPKAFLERALRGDPDWQVRMEAASELLGSGVSWPLAEGILDFPEPAPSAEPAAAADAAVDMDLEPGARRSALAAIARAPAVDDAAGRAAADALLDPFAAVRAEAVIASGAAGPAARGGLAALRAMLEHPRRDMRRAALWALISAGGADAESSERLRSRFHDPLPTDRMLWAYCAGRSGPGDSRLVRALETALRDRESFVRLEAVRALARLGPGARGARRGLERLARRDPALAPAAERALRALGGEG